MARVSSPIARSLEPIAGVVWPLFVALSLLIAGLWTFGLGEAELLQRLSGTEGRSVTLDGTAARQPEWLVALLYLLESLDLTWMALAAMLAYRHTAAEVGVKRARAWAAGLLLAAFLIALALSFRPGTAPLVAFSGNFGPRLARVSLGWLLLCVVLALGFRDAAHRLLPGAGHAWTRLAIAGAFLAALPLVVFPTAVAQGWIVASPARSAPGPAAAAATAASLLIAGATLALWRDPILRRPVPPGVAPSSLIVAMVLSVFLLRAVGAQLGW